jgi:hypothetical protein
MLPISCGNILLFFIVKKYTSQEITFGKSHKFITLLIIEYIKRLCFSEINACMEGLYEGKVFLVIETIATFQKWTLLDVIHRHLKHSLDDKALKGDYLQY